MGFAATIRKWRSNRAYAHEFDALGPDQREALARDIGVSENVLSGLLARGPHAASELLRLMEALSLDADRIRHAQAPLMRDMSIACAECSAGARCRRDLDRGWASSAYREYCPNAETLRELQERTARR